MAKTQENHHIYALFGLLSLSLLAQHANASFPYYGTKIGSLKQLHHGVSGDVYAVDSRTIFLKNFNYDGEAPAAYFYVGNTNKPSNEGASRLRDERGGTASLTRRYRNKDITLSLPEKLTLRDIKWFSVWCDEFAVNFGDVVIPTNLDFPRPQKISALKGVHGVASDNIVIVDAQTLLVPNFSYDGEAPDAKFWVGRGQRPTPQGLRIPDENGKENPLRRYDRKTIVLTLPADLTIFDIGHFGVWCEAFTVDFGHVRIPEGLNVPPSLKMLGISPQSKLNCEVLYDDLAFEVRWAVAGESIVVQLVAKLGTNEYMSFGISPSKDRSQMIGADVVVAWVDKDTGKGFAQDYYLDDKSQCSGGRGTCPDVNIEDNTNSIRLLNAAMVNGYSIVTYQRSLQATDKLDLPISVNGSEAIVWAIGPLNERKEASFHSHYTKRTHYIEFGRQPTWNCPMPEGSKTSASSDESSVEDEDSRRDTSVEGYPPAKSSPSTPASEPDEEFYDNRAQALQRQPNRRPEATRPASATEQSTSQRTRAVPTPKPANTNGAWDIPAIQCYEPEDGVFYAQMGPTGGVHGYPAITGHVGWGISWYINGLLIPEIHVVRGKTYTFVVEGGNNPDIPAKYHPFYITDDPMGGYEHKREEEKKAIRIFAGVHRSRSGQVTPTGVGRLCNWTPDVDGPLADDYQSFGAYQRTLTLKCDPGEPGVITWKPDQNTPDTVYYHCFTHRYLGWKIHVHDSCDDARYAASEKHEIRVPANIAPEDNVAEASIRHETKVSPNDNFLLKHQTDLIKNHNMNGTPPKLTFEITKSTEITKLISDGIRAAEALEESILRNPNSNNNHLHHNSNRVATQGTVPPPPTSQYIQHPLSKSPTGGVFQQTVDGKIPPKPYIPSAAPEILHGETQLHQYHYSQSPSNAHPQLLHSAATGNSHSFPHQQQPSHQLHHHHHHFSNNLTNLPVQSQKTIGLSEYLRPPQNAPLFHPVKLPGRRPYPGPVKKVTGLATKPILPQQLPRHPSLTQQLNSAIPLPSVIVNHYRKPLPGLLKTFLKEKPFPIQPIAASVLMLGQPTELGLNLRKNEPIIHSKPKPIIPVPYSDLVPQDSIQSNVFAFNTFPKNEQKHPVYVKVPGHMSENSKPESLQPPITAATPAVVFKKPFDVHEVKEEPTSLDIATMKPAVNNGFQPDSVVVESGFRPILRRDGVMPPDGVIDQVALRREDPGSEIDDVMETDTLFLTAQKDAQTQNFEPMFIPSPPDSTNTTIVLRKAVPSTSPIQRSPVASAISAEMPATAELVRSPPTLEDLLEDPEEKEEDIVLNNNKATTRNENVKEVERIDEKDQTIETRKDDSIDLDLADKFDDVDEFVVDEEEEEIDDTNDEYEKEAQAAQRIDTYYLPPDNRKIPHASIPSGAVVTYDGKSVVDSSLVLPPKLEARDTVNLRSSNQNQGLSRIEQLIRSTPQFLPFRGKIPPAIADFLSTERSLRLVNSPITEYSNPLSSPPLSFSASSSSSSDAHASPSSSTFLPLTASSTLVPPPTRPLSTKLHILNNSA